MGELWLVASMCRDIWWLLLHIVRLGWIRRGLRGICEFLFCFSVCWEALMCMYAHLTHTRANHINPNNRTQILTHTRINQPSCRHLT
ncbi:hypothetical protein EDB19DRAFT_1782509 [Suillus lakei]|nr:hypothetical protein EDB19DRAFT_1782509 [Suillus lakei]